MTSITSVVGRAHSSSGNLVKTLFQCRRTSLAGGGSHKFLHQSTSGSSYSLTSCCYQNWKPSEPFLHLQKRSVHLTSRLNELKTYDPDGKTTVNILNDEMGAPLMIDTYTQTGFKLNNGMKVIGPMIIFPRTVLGWDVSGIQDVTPESLALFSILEPKPDVLVIGVGNRGSKLSLDVVKFLRNKKINIEVLSTEHACSTFNFLSVEGRRCAGVMIPPDRIVWTSQELADSKMKKHRIYDEELDMSPFEKHPEEMEGEKKPK